MRRTTNGAVRSWLRPGRGVPDEATEAVPADDRALKHYRRLGRMLLGPKRFRRFDPDVSFTVEAAEEMVATIQRLRARGEFAMALGEGQDVETALVRAVRALVRTDDPNNATALAVSVGDLPGGAHARWMGLGLVVGGSGFRHAAWTHFAAVPVDVLAAHVAVEAAECAFAEGSAEARQVALELGRHTGRMDLETLIGLAGLYDAFGERSDAIRLLDEVASRTSGDLPDTVAARYRNLRGWVDGTRRPAAPEAPDALEDGVVTIGILDQNQPDHDAISTDLGDHIQTLAVLGNLARFGDVTFTGPEGVGALVTTLQERVTPALRIPTPASTARLVPVSRDFSEGEPIAPGTWLIAAGRHLDPVHRVRYGLPYHPNLRPLFVSFHLAAHEALDEATIAYLASHGPIGCRDWTTVDALLSVGVEAFFTGCVSTTVDTVLPAAATVDRRTAEATLVVDCPSYLPPAGARIATATHESPELREATLAQGAVAADELLRGYQREARAVVTSRLHSYLPAVGLGLEVDFRPDRPGDITLDGLLGLTAGGAELAAMQDGLRELLTTVLGDLLAGCSEAEVYARWRELTADRVAQARRRFETRVEVTDRLDDVAAAITTVASRRTAFGPHDGIGLEVTDVALSLDQNLRAMLPTTVESLIANATGPVRLWITTRGLDETYFRWFAAAFPQVPITFLDFSGIEYGEVKRIFRHISMTTMDRLILPEVLAELDRLVYVDIDTVTEGDVGELGALDLAGAPLAAKNPDERVAFSVWRDAGNLLDAELASELRRTMAARHPVTFRTLNAGVLVLDLARMRSDRFVETFLPLVARYGLNDQDILNAYAGPGYLRLDPKWNAIPRQEVISEPGIVHYVGGGKPWGEKLVPYSEHWKAWQERVTRRVGWPPT